MEDMAAVGEAITQGYSSLQQPKVPAPPVFKGQQESVHIEVFFAHFEIFCNHVYRDDQNAWLQVLPDYLAGEPKNLSLVFGLEPNYAQVKQKLVEKYRRASRLGDGEIQNIFHATRKPDESYEMFAIRSHVLAAQWRDATDSNRHAIVRAPFLDILEPVMRQRVNTQFGHETTAVEFQRIADFVSNPEILQQDKAVAKAAAIPPIETATGTSAEIKVTPVEITLHKPRWSTTQNRC